MTLPRPLSPPARRASASMAGGDVETQDLPLGPDGAGQRQRGLTGAAADVDHLLTGAHADVVDDRLTPRVEAVLHDGGVSRPVATQVDPVFPLLLVGPTVGTCHHDHSRPPPPQRRWLAAVACLAARCPLTLPT